MVGNAADNVACAATATTGSSFPLCACIAMMSPVVICAQRRQWKRSRARLARPVEQRRMDRCAVPS